MYRLLADNQRSRSNAPTLGRDARTSTLPIIPSIAVTVLNAARFIVSKNHIWTLRHLRISLEVEVGRLLADDLPGRFIPNIGRRPGFGITLPNPPTLDSTLSS